MRDTAARAPSEILVFEHSEDKRVDLVLKKKCWWAKLMLDRCRDLVEHPNQPHPMPTEATDEDDKEARACYHSTHPVVGACGRISRAFSDITDLAASELDDEHPPAQRHRPRYVQVRLPSANPEGPGTRTAPRVGQTCARRNSALLYENYWGLGAARLLRA